MNEQMKLKKKWKECTNEMIEQKIKCNEWTNKIKGQSKYLIFKEKW